MLMKKEKMIYLAGDMLKKGSIMLRNQESKEVRELGYKVYSPIEDKSINDKSNQSEESNNGLAEKIVRNDTRGILFHPTHRSLCRQIPINRHHKHIGSHPNFFCRLFLVY